MPDDRQMRVPTRNAAEGESGTLTGACRDATDVILSFETDLLLTRIALAPTSLSFLHECGKFRI